MTITVVALLCSIYLSPRDCNRSNATDVIPLGEAPGYIDCMMSGQMSLAGLALKSDEEHSWIIRCFGPTSIGRDHVG